MREQIGMVGLGAMGGPIAANIAAGGYPMVVFDIAGTRDRAPSGAVCAASVAEVARETEIILLSLPTIAAGLSVIDEIIASGAAEGTLVVDLSTVGPDVAQTAHRQLADAGAQYLDAPVSGQAFKAIDGTLSVMFSGPDAALERIQPVLDCMASNVFKVGNDPGQGQLMKVVNNYLSISSFVTTSEALAFGERYGLKMGSMLDVVNASTGQNFTTSATFPKHVLPGTFDMDGLSGIMPKDLGLFVEAARRDNAPRHLAEATMDVVSAFAKALPEADQSEIYKYIRDGKFEG